MVDLGPSTPEELAVWRQEQKELRWEAAEDKGRLLETLGWQTGVSAPFILLLNLWVAHAPWGPFVFTAVATMCIGIVLAAAGDKMRPGESDLADVVANEADARRAAKEPRKDPAHLAEIETLTVKHYQQQMSLREYVKKLEQESARREKLERKLREQEPKPLYPEGYFAHLREEKQKADMKAFTDAAAMNGFLEAIRGLEAEPWSFREPECGNCQGLSCFECGGHEPERKMGWPGL